jgi:hypothetical protein
MKIKDNLLRIALLDSAPVEFAMGIYAFAQLPKVWGLPQDRILAGCVVFLGIWRLYAVLEGMLKLRLAVAYVACFVWVYFILFTWMEAPVEYVTGGAASTLINVWIAWRLQTESHLYKTAKMVE